MSTLTVGSGQTYSSIAAAVSAAQSGDTIDVLAGTYTNDFTTVTKSLSFDAVGGVVTMAATVSPPNGKAIVDEGGSNVSVSFDGFAFTGASVGDGNGAGIRYEGGNLTITNSHFYGNQEGLLANSDPSGTISISSSEFDHNGAGDGYSHNIYIGDIAKFTLTNSYIHDANAGHEVKSRAETNVITDNRIFDYASTSSYEIDLPNGGNATIAGNIIEQGPNSGNPTIIAYGEEGNLQAGTSLSVTGNTIINDESSGLALWNAGGGTAIFAGNSVYGFGAAALVLGAVTQAGTTVLASKPVLDQSALNLLSANAVTSATATVTTAVTAPATTASATPVTTSATTASTTPVTIPVATASTTPVTTTVATASTTPVVTAASTTPVTTAVTTALAAAVTTPVVPAATAAGLVVNVAEDAWQGDAQFAILLDGQQVGGTYTATASEAAGQSQAISVATTLGSGAHTLGISFLNDAWGGSASTDRNLYVTGASYNGQSIPGSTFEEASSGTTTVGFVAGAASSSTTTVPVAGSTTVPVTGNTTTVPVTGNTTTVPAVTSTATLMVSEDAWQGDAQFTVSVDGQQIGGVYTATALHAAGQSQAISIPGIAEAFTPHDIAVTFLNDAYGGSPAADRNLYVDSLKFDGQAVSGASLVLYSSGTQHLTAVAPAGWTG